MRDAADYPRAADLFNDLEPDPPKRWTENGPGLVVAALATMAAGFVADHYSAPLTLMALLIGLALNFLGNDPRMAAGLGFASRTLLRWGIVLVGARVTIAQIVGLGPSTLLAVVLILLATLGTGVLVARAMGLSSAFGTLAGGAVAICGASAALALATTLGERRVNQAQLALVLVGISAASATAMFFYPLIAHSVGLSDRQAGLMLGASIHDVAQAIGAGYSFSDHAGEVATIVKLTRVALLAPVLALLTVFFPASDGKKTKLSVPWFVTGFFVVAAVNSVVPVPPIVGRSAQTLATAFLACAVAATGIRAPMNALLGTGIKPLLVIVASSLVALALAFAAALLIF
ncbi:putative integral membrane protein (TIGR00698 family) [Sphingomonas insulae]|uniref:Sulfate exporter family transporter n=1 Tax=Sphingomonas insulae TaxID=424800 RepID=A0ABN1HRW4_9SPHN|nr:putative sulfate exporter family transporter [Sphingomonas insulae]NIJ29092.1 putative integral membrane protein (TIGR00698 family) [Sphingomonas insulae]